MDRPLFVLSLVFFANAGVVRVPKIYNALISSDANLTPSQAYPILEPVYRTTALGVAFPPIVVHPPLIQNPITKDIENEQKDNKKTEYPETAMETNETTQLNKTEDDEKKEAPARLIPELAYHGTLYPLAYDPYFPYAYTSDFLFPQLPFYQRPLFTDFPQAEGAKEAVTAKKQHKPIPTNHNNKKSDIPDVPPPPLPVTNREENKEKKAQ